MPPISLLPTLPRMPVPRPENPLAGGFSKIGDTTGSYTSASTRTTEPLPAPARPPRRTPSRRQARPPPSPNQRALAIWPLPRTTDSPRRPRIPLPGGLRACWLQRPSQRTAGRARPRMREWPPPSTTSHPPPARRAGRRRWNSLLPSVLWSPSRTLYSSSAAAGPSRPTFQAALPGLAPD